MPKRNRWTALRGAFNKYFGHTPLPNQVEFELPLDKGIEKPVHILLNAGVETYESCEGGPGHSYPEPTIRFHGDRAAGFRALAVAIEHDLPVKALRRIWNITDGELTGPTWEMTLWCD